MIESCQKLIEFLSRTSENLYWSLNVVNKDFNSVKPGKSQENRTFNIS